MKRRTQRGRGDDNYGQLQIAWSDPVPAAAVAEQGGATTIAAERAPGLVQRLKWDFRTTFPQPTPEALEAGVLSEEDAELDNVAAIHGEHIREGLFVLHSLDAVLDARRRGVDPASGKAPATAAAKERLQKLLETEPSRLERWFQTLMETYEEAFGPEAVDAFGKALRAWQAGIEVVAEDKVSATPVPNAAPERPQAEKQIARRRGPSRVVARLPVPRPLPSAVAAGHFGRDELGKTIRPGSHEIREITEQHAEKLIDLLDGDNRSVPEAQRWNAQEAFRNGIAAYAEDFGPEAAEQLEAYVRRQAGLEISSRRGR